MSYRHYVRVQLRASLLTQDIAKGTTGNAKRNLWRACRCTDRSSLFRRSHSVKRAIQLKHHSPNRAFFRLYRSEKDSQQSYTEVRATTLIEALYARGKSC
jgi:hypothetical protein